MRLGEEPLSLAVVDVDRFKEVNDDTSHTHGDAVLRRVADLLREHSRTGDEVYRWAGDEFLVVLPTATEAQAVAVMERLRAAVAGGRLGDLELPEPVTVTIGVATAPAREPAPGRTPATTRRPPRSSAGAHCSTPPTCTCSPPSAAAATGCAPPGTGSRRRHRGRPGWDRSLSAQTIDMIGDGA